MGLATVAPFFPLSSVFGRYSQGVPLYPQEALASGVFCHRSPSGSFAQL